MRAAANESRNMSDLDLENAQDETWKQRAKHWVVIVDDEESIRVAVGQYLYDQGYQVTACADADAFIEVILTSSGTPTSHRTGTSKIPSAAVPDVIISDVRMPGKDGLELTEMIRESERLRRVPVVLLTAKSMDQDRIAGYKAGADVYLPKPFNPEELLSIVDNTIQRKVQMAGRDGRIADLAQDLSDVKKILQFKGQRTKSPPQQRPYERSTVHLTPKEQHVLELLSEGYTNPEIAEIRGNKSVGGVNRTVQVLYRKTGANTRTALVRWGIQNGFIAKPKR